MSPIQVLRNFYQLRTKTDVIPFLQTRSSDSEVVQSVKTTEQVWQKEESWLPMPANPQGDTIYSVIL